MTTWTKVTPITTNYTPNTNESSVIYTDVENPNYQWNYDLNKNIGMSEIGRPIGLLLVLTRETTEFRADWNKVDQHTTNWNNI